MLRGIRPSSLARVGLTALCIAAVGALIGVGAERMTFRGAPPEGDGFLNTAPAEPRPRTPGPWEREVVQRATDGLPPYPGAAPRPLEADFLGPRAPIAVAWFETQDPPERVLSFYRRAILERGIPIVEDRTGPRSGYVGYKNPRTREVHLITAIAEGGHTLVFPSKGKVEGLGEGGQQLPAALPTPEGLQKPTVLRFGREGVAEYSVLGRVGGRSVEQVVDFYRQAFPARGWTVDPVQRREDGVSMEAKKGRARVSVTVRRRPGGETELYVQLVQPT